MEKRLKIFISAYACEPEKGSEPGIGWNVVNELARSHEIHVLTRANNREAIETALAGRENDIPVFHYYDLPRWAMFWKKKKRGYRFYYYLWQYGAFLHYRKWVNAAGFDLVQHLTFANFAVPSLFMFCKPITVYGPIGISAIPRAVFADLPTKIKIRESLRRWTMALMIHLEPCRWLTPRCADWIIECGNAPGHSCFPRRWQSKIRHHSQTGINTGEKEYRCERTRPADGKTRLLICSEFLHWKGIIFAVKTFAAIARNRKDIELVIYGDGPLKQQMRQILAEHNVADQARFMGFVGKQEMIQSLFDADILLYPSYHHGLATLILQSMYARLPIIALQGDAVALAVSEGAGLVAQGETMKEILLDLQQKTVKLIDSPELRQQLGAKGRELIEQKYEWRVMVQKLSSLLGELHNGAKP